MDKVSCIKRLFFTLFPLMLVIGFLAYCSIPFNKDIYPLSSQLARTVSVPKITLSPQKAFYLTTDIAPSVSITCTLSDASILYALNSVTIQNPYTSPFSVSYAAGTTTNTILTYATKEEFNQSNIVSSNITFVPSGNIFTIAGTGTANTYGDGLFGYNATLKAPSCVTYNSTALTVYFADTEHNTIRKIDSNGFISTVAGTGNTTYTSAEDSTVPALSANLSAPSGLCLDASGNLYVADTGNNRIRYINMSVSPPTITRIAGTGNTTWSSAEEGGLPVNANLSAPYDFCIKGNDLYVSDTGNNRIRHIDLGSSPQTITTIAGTGNTTENIIDGNPATTANLSAPSGLALDSPGKKLYVADSGHHRIRMIDLVGTPLIYNYAGTGTPGYASSQDGGPAASAQLSNPTGLDFSGSLLYIADTGNNLIRQIKQSSGVITTIAGNATQGYAGNNGLPSGAVFNSPKGIFYDASGIFIADTGNNCIRKIFTY